MKMSLKRSFYILEPLVVYIILHDVIQFVLYIIINHIAAGENAVYMLLKRDAAYVTSGVQILSMLLGMLGLMAFERLLAKRRAANGAIYGAESGGRTEKGGAHGEKAFQNLTAADWKKICFQTAISVLQMLLLAFSLNVILLNSALGGMSGSFAEVSDIQAGMPLIMAVVLFGIVSPLMEEYVFRGMLFVRLKELFPLPLSIGISALFFGVYHGNLVQGIYGFLMGSFLAYTYESVERRRIPGPLFTVTLCHALANLLIYFGSRLGLITGTPVYVGVLLMILALGVVYFCNCRDGSDRTKLKMR